ncbi:hypothetical protein ATN00_01110 [Sphingobium baderi]|uniref:Uncharacterized protein n=1 Tax=Sphingobium baderi TaxID=1332080 RepID=A0A0S3EUM6_9SPHN|nr:hypothetical protein ATN00_01110 [Sphingobium baderi]
MLVAFLGSIHTMPMRHKASTIIALMLAIGDRHGTVLVQPVPTDDSRAVARAGGAPSALARGTVALKCSQR